MINKVSKLLQNRFPLCDDAYFEKVAGEIDAIYNKENNVDWAGGYTASWGEAYNDPLERVNKYFEDDQGIVDTTIIQ